MSDIQPLNGYPKTTVYSKTSEVGTQPMIKQPAHTPQDGFNISDKDGKMKFVSWKDWKEYLEKLLDNKTDIKRDETPPQKMTEARKNVVHGQIKSLEKTIDTALKNGTSEWTDNNGNKYKLTKTDDGNCMLDISYPEGGGSVVIRDFKKDSTEERQWHYDGNGKMYREILKREGNQLEAWHSNGTRSKGETPPPLNITTNLDEWHINS